MTKLLNEKASGVYIISATPFNEDGTIDMDSADSLTDFYLDKGVDGITILGIMGEAPKLTAEESKAFMKHIIKRVNGRVPVVVGVSNAGMDNLAALANSAMDLGAAGVMVAPFAAHKTDEAIFNYFAAVDKALGSKIPLIYQDYPLTTNATISIPCLLRIIREIPQMVMLKHEEWPGLAKLSALRKKTADEGLRRISVLCGNGGLFLPQELARGADGAMTGFAFPEMLVEVCKKFADGDSEGAEDLYDAYLPLIRYEQQLGIGLAVRKEILRRRGAIKCARARAPGPTLTAEDHQDIDRLLRRLDNKLASLN
ncbi:MAG: dihydrodipicolinate synthase family protein [Alphaproteobacteria bacterium]|nr:dihydrodipicolinate synthase family protein [Alphaproteobacteria bacterium]HPF46167.1 dihydrodipicolinate synthase family protein [Emcibacteraceae bacterium]HRW28635.1 dihydrodipicolinate synthase family protein [Emcibacteraceae bacterium]